MGMRAFRMSLFKKGVGVDAAKQKLQHLYERATPFAKKKIKEKKQQKLDKLCAKGPKALIPPQFHYFYHKDYVAP